MNFWWELFAIDDTALGGWYANGVRLATIALGVLLTVFKDRLWPRLAREDANVAFAATPPGGVPGALATASLAERAA